MSFLAVLDTELGLHANSTKIKPFPEDKYIKLLSLNPEL